ncbi:MAG: hypothetical protein HRT35_28125 [Algicola sp.]|nr:hypothetical protein [Algicola sp.]
MKKLTWRKQSRESWQALAEWVDDEQAILDFAFPDGLSEADQTLLLDDLAILKSQPWSMQKCIATVLDDWPADQPTKDFSTARYEQAAIAECERVLKL